MMQEEQLTDEEIARVSAAISLSDEVQLPESGYVKDEAYELCGQIVHATVKALNDWVGQPTLLWEKNRDSIIHGIRQTLDDPSRTPEENHQSWMNYKLEEGWTLGPRKSAEAKTHPCLLPYTMLSPNDRIKDSLFQAIVRAFFGIQPEPEVDPRLEECAQRLKAKASELFRVEDGPAQSKTDAGAPYVVYAFRAKAGDTRDWLPTLETRMVEALSALLAKGASRLILRYHDGFRVWEEDGFVHVYTRFVALNEEDELITTDDGREVGAEMIQDITT